MKAVRPRKARQVPPDSKTGPKLLARGENLGALAVFSGFRRNELDACVRAWQLEIDEGSVDGLYLIERAPWSAAANELWERARIGVNGLFRATIGGEDALVGQAGVVWLAPGRRLARIALAEDGRNSASFDELVGAALSHAMAFNGWLPLHGMAATVANRGVLAMGGTMTGKSTLAVAMLHVGARLVSDDFLLVHRSPRGAEMSALRRDLRLREPTWGLVPDELRDRLIVESASSGRRVLRRVDAPERFVSRATPLVLWFLDGLRSDSIVEIWPLSQAEALALVVEATSPLFLGARYLKERERILPVMIAVVESTRSFRVRLGTHLLRTPVRAVSELLKRTLKGPFEESSIRQT